MAYNHKRQKNSDPDILQTIVVGIFKILWWLVTLPFKGFKRSQKPGLSVAEKNSIANKRTEIENLLHSDSSIELKHAVMEADKLVDHILKLKGYAGETFADRLRNAQNYIDRNLYNDLWEGHKVRNQIAHEQELRIDNSELRVAAQKLLNYTKSI